MNTRGWSFAGDSFGTMEVSLRGLDALGNNSVNKGTAFTAAERKALGLEGLLPAFVSSLEHQLRRAHQHIVTKDDPLEQYIGLAALHDRNEHLFYRLLLDHIEEMLPIVYTPTVGLATQRFSHIFRKPRGIWITPHHRGRIAEVLRNSPNHDISLIVVTDSERILGLGDQGAGGIWIPIGKLAIYSVAAGIHPSRTLPICLDVGTDNRNLLDDDLYLGFREPRMRGPEYDSMVDEFVEAVAEVFPQALLQWEDFKKVNAINLLDRYVHRLPSFNDDIQGTAAVGLAGVLAGARATKTPLSEHRIVILGAGAAGVGIARLLEGSLREAGLDGQKLRGAIAILDSRGLLVESRDDLEPYKRLVAWPDELARSSGLDPSRRITFEDTVAALHPTVLIGTSGQPGIFSERIIRDMAAHCDRPLIFPFSNPTSMCEAKPVDLMAWTEGRALVATGSPFPPVQVGDRTLQIGQGNNAYIFPGVGLGAIVAEARTLTWDLFAVAAKTLANEVREEHLELGQLFPPLSDLRRISARIATEVARRISADGLGPELSDSEIHNRIEEQMWSPDYPEIVAV